MHRSRLGNIVIDCPTEDLLAEARFWSDALGYPLPPDADPSTNFVQLVTPADDVRVIIQRVRHEPDALQRARRRLYTDRSGRTRDRR